MDIKLQVQDLQNLENKLQNLEKDVAKKIVKKGVREAQKLALAEEKNNALSMVGGDLGAKIAGALKVLAVNKQKKGSYALQVAIDPKQAEQFVHNTAKGIRYYIPTAIEYGHKKRGGGMVAPIPFARRAADSTAQARVNTVASAIKKGIDSI